ncbi:VCBS repeat-containing protein [Mucilaginibacter sp. UR6-11]|uniref:VCBS repeat-containing protein n=1 Tax=Mucilaginibacter sp. UR6-11 TaxID=1435644 RepID=UPI001E284217|nr:VCBS repeat-containing protein [Mucilaginibacter sp. UR6-11]MCC8423748.1 VCBS repeat-containing protein [Mucilaginibacter sp. UR6-11]
MLKIYVAICCIAILSGCSRSGKDNSNIATEKPLFTLLDSSKTGVLFNNKITEDFNKNILNYQAFYNGGGVAVGDINGDGLEDIYFSGNMTSNKLYLNRGNLKFDDITDQAGVAGRDSSWKTGVNMVDVNGDGKLDIYQCYSGKGDGNSRKNQLFINQGLDSRGVPIFKDEAESYGLADSSYSTQSYFFDYDGDGDLDLLLVNENIKALHDLDDAVIQKLKNSIDQQACSKLYRNDNGHFKDVTKEAGLDMSTFSFGLGAAIADINCDGLPDIYLSNDFSIPDKMYINNGDGTFTDQMRNTLDHISFFSMGNSITDVNNDGLPDIFTLDMLPEDNKRQKLLSSVDNYEAFNINLRNGFYYQYMRNMLHINNGDGTFSEIGQLAGISNTDWSWAPLFADYDNDGWKDLYVTNGYMRDFTNMDVIKFNENYFASINGEIEPRHVLDMLNNMPSSDVKNYIFKNNGGLNFTDKGAAWGINIPSNSNGAVYSDLDNDGNLDLVINNINRSAFIYKNMGNPAKHYLNVKLVGAGKNTGGIGALVTVFNKGRQQVIEEMPSAGYLSSVSAQLHFGLGNDKKIDSVRVVWVGGKQQVIKNVPANQLITLRQSEATTTYQKPVAVPPIFKEISSPLASGQQPNEINDFKRQPLLVNPLSFVGPCMARGDVNGDGLEDVYVGGDSKEAGTLFIQQRGGKYIKNQQPFVADKESQDADAVFFDANGDGHIDLYVVSGGYANFKDADPLFQDRLYLNDGKGNMVKATGSLPAMLVSKSCARVGDFNGDGKPDLFVGGRNAGSNYPEAPKSFILINDGKGHFTDQIKKIAPDLEYIGMVTDAAVIDMNADKKQDLVLVGDWLPVSVFINQGGKLKNQTTHYFDKQYTGWWNSLKVDDFNGDGKPDLVVGNLGLNSQCKVNDSEPAELYYKDFDDNGAIDPILCFYIMGKSYPYLTRDELLDQMSIMRGRFSDYKSYADAGINDVFTDEERKGVKILKTNYLATAYFESTASGKFKEKALPVQAQYSPVFTITSLDYDGDGHKDLLLCGNIYHSRIRFGRYDANHGMLFKGDGKGGFKYVPEQQSGLKLKGDVRSVITVNNTLFVGINQQKMRAFKF